MPKFIIDVTVTKYERWEVEAENQELATDDYGEGRLLSCSDEDTEITKVTVKD